MLKRNKEEPERGLDKIVSEAVNQATESATKKAVETLHPKDKQHADRLSILSDQEVAAHAIMEWVTDVISKNSLSSGVVMKGFSEKVKALKVSKGGVGRNEVSTIFKPEIIGAMLQQGMIPMGSDGTPLVNRQSDRMLRRRLI